jgi:hypothetical protein
MKDKTKETTRRNLIKKLANSLLNDSLEQVLDNNNVDFDFIGQINAYAMKKKMGIYFFDKFPHFSLELKKKVIKILDDYAKDKTSFNHIRTDYINTLISHNEALKKEENIDLYHELLWKQEAKTSKHFIWILKQENFDWNKKYTISHNYFFKDKKINFIDYIFYNFLRKGIEPVFKSLFKEEAKLNDYPIFKEILNYLNTTHLKTELSLQTLENVKKEFKSTELDDILVKWLEKEILNLTLETKPIESKKHKI